MNREAWVKRFVEARSSKGALCAMRVRWRPMSIRAVARVIAKRTGESEENTAKAIQRLERGVHPRDLVLVAFLAHFYGLDVGAAVSAFAYGQDPWGNLTRHAERRLSAFLQDVSQSPGGRDTQLEPSVPPSSSGDE